MKVRTKHARSGFSLLEVILALAILAGAVATLGELVRRSMLNAAYARDMAQAQLLCESKMAEIAAGITYPDPVVDAMIAPEDLVNPYDPVAWVYTIETGEADQPGLLAVAVTVGQDLPPERRPARFTLVRWVVDPGIEISDPRATETDGAYGAGSSGQSQSSTGGTP